MSEYVRVTLPAKMLSNADTGADVLAINGTPVSRSMGIWRNANGLTVGPYAIAPLPYAVDPSTPVTIGWFAG
jgi:hypothetical protein